MRAQFSQTVQDSRVSVREGTFETTLVPDGWADLVVVAQAFHWCPDYDKAMAEFNRALAPNGRAVFIWNLEDSATAWVRQVRQTVEAFEGGTPQYRLGLWRKTFQTPSYLKYFEPPEEMIFKHIITGSLTRVLDRVYSKSFIAISSNETKEQIGKQVKEIVDRGDDKVWLDQKQGTFEYPYINTVIVMRKK
ncbi:hypothetical protein JB92DRAFT_2947584 [Gautieria morchelliformis]|nr:hypothetical protein JB92DRAFT_2947584 [Gautieria morchelliformis]